jgi:hypothetical protein
LDRRERLLPPILGSDLRDLREDLEDLEDLRLRPPEVVVAVVEEVPNIEEPKVPDICFI